MLVNPNAFSGGLREREINPKATAPSATAWMPPVDPMLGGTSIFLWG
jgi:hypothetical protein